MRSTRVLQLIALTAFFAGCGAGQYGYAREYNTTGDESRYLEQTVDLPYEDVRRFHEEHAEAMLGWFGVVEEIVSLNEETGEARLRLSLRAHRERHLCANMEESSCRVTVSERELGPFVATLELRPDEIRGEHRLWTGSLVRVYGHAAEAGDEDTGPTIESQWHRHWPHGTYVTTGAARSMRQ